MGTIVINAIGFILTVALMINCYVDTDLYFLVRKQGGGPGVKTGHVSYFIKK
jgi:hypothetical protein